LKEAKRLNIPVFAIVDTNSNPKLVDFPIPGNDDATKSISIIMDAICGAVKEGLTERKNAKDAPAKDKEEAPATEAKAKEAPKAEKAPAKEEAPKAEVKEEAPAKEEAPKAEAKEEAAPEAKAEEAKEEKEAK
jgi:small subunit ribosomal protein S2